MKMILINAFWNENCENVIKWINEWMNEIKNNIHFKIMQIWRFLFILQFLPLVENLSC